MAHIAEQPALLTSLTRTLVPLAVGILGGLAARYLGVDLPAGPLEEIVTVLVAGVYYTIARVLEEHLSPVWGRILLGLGLRGTPTYTQKR